MTQSDNGLTTSDASVARPPPVLGDEGDVVAAGGFAAAAVCNALAVGEQHNF